MDKLKLIKATVFILTFLLIFGTLCILGLFYQKTHKKESEVLQSISLRQPVGSYIKEIRTQNDKLYILTVGGGQEDRIIIFDTQNNQVSATVKIN